MDENKLVHVALMYDFDSTLSIDNIQDYNFIPALNMTEKSFWTEVDKVRYENNMDNVLAYMYVMLKKAKEKSIPVTEENFIKFGTGVKFFQGLDTWFDRINGYANSLGIKVHHYVISSGIAEMIKGTSIAHYFDNIYASSFMYENGVAIWPSLAINYTNKTQFLFRINKGMLNITDDNVNEFVEEENKAIPFTHMMYIGDGLTDVPCMKLVKNYGGKSIAVYNSSKSEEVAKKLLETERVNYIAKANYLPDSLTEKLVFNWLKEKVKEK